MCILTFHDIYAIEYITLLLQVHNSMLSRPFNTAFKFCLKYERKTEFRKLCENLRTHLQQVYKHSNQPRSVNLEKLESQSMHLEVRLVQLDHAINLELWQEAFKVKLIISLFTPFFIDHCHLYICK